MGALLSRSGRLASTIPQISRPAIPRWNAVHEGCGGDAVPSAPLEMSQRDFLRRSIIPELNFVPMWVAVPVGVICSVDRIVT